MEPLLPGLQLRLDGLRKRRGFRVERWVEAKIALLNSYARATGLSSVVVGVSGGIDSAIVLSLAKRASECPGSNLKRVVGICLPYLKLKQGTTNQSDATSRGKAVIASIGAESMVVDLTETLKTLQSTMDKEGGIKGDAWATGQLVSYLRTPALYYATAQLSQAGYPCFVLGTTNRDEGAYIGYFGKAADAMNDVQLISDLHKSEVYQVAHYLGNIPREVIDAAPTGDIHDGRTDEQLIGVPYDFIELHALASTIAHPTELKVPFADKNESEQWKRMSERVEQLHRENKHKYLGGSVALHFDVWPRAVSGGWKPQNEESDPPEHPNSSHFVNLVTLDPVVLEMVEKNSAGLLTGAIMKDETIGRKCLTGMGDAALQITSLLSKEECKALIQFTTAHSWVPAGIDGMRLPKSDSEIGSFRLSFYSLALANALWRRLAPHIDIVRHFDDYSSTDFDDHPLWRAVGVSPLFRAIKYHEDGYLIPHYDSSYSYSKTTKTLMSVVIYLSEPSDGSGRTRFILDRQRYLPRNERVYKDAFVKPSPRDIILDVEGLVGSALIFDHRIYHDSDQLRVPEHKIILRTDIVFEQCGLASTSPLYVSKPLGMPTGSKNVSKYSGNGRPYSSHNQHSTPLDADDRLYRKHLKDPYYSTVMAMTGNFDTVLEAGFFDDGAPAHDEVDSWIPQWEVAPLNWFSTPISKILKRLAIYNQSSHQRTVSLSTLKTSPPGSLSPKSYSSTSDTKSSNAQASSSKNKAKSKEDRVATQSSPFAKRFVAPGVEDTENRWLAVILTTGSFNPVHKGHLDMMEQGKLAVEANGGFVLGGYISPSHDLYVGMKLKGEALSAKHRLQLCEMAVEDSNWMMVDGWEALEVQYPVNFTDVIVHLEQYLSAHIATHKPIHIVYVYGSDHTRFSLTFVSRGKGVCLNRPGYEEKLQNFQELDFFHSIARNVIFWEIPTLAMSSTEARKGEKHGLLPLTVTPAYLAMLSRNGSHPTNDLSEAKITYHIRDEGAWAYQNLLKAAKAKTSIHSATITPSSSNNGDLTSSDDKSIEDEFANAWSKFCSRIMKVIMSSHALCESPDMPRSVEFLRAELEDQRLALNKIREKYRASGYRIINLDVCLQISAQSTSQRIAKEDTKGFKSVDSMDEILEVSRVFSIAMGPQSAIISNRPGSPSIEHQIESIPAGKYVLFDDDSFTGFTLQTVADLIRSTRPDIEIAHAITLTSSSPIKLENTSSQKAPKQSSSNTTHSRDTSNGASKDMEIIDMRDFLLGSHHGGLVVSLRDDSHARAPYALPYVSPTHRASIPISKETLFSIEVWKANVEFFESLSRRLYVHDLDSATAALLADVGFPGNQTCLKVAQWHLQRLQELWKPPPKTSLNWSRI